MMKYSNECLVSETLEGSHLAFEQLVTRYYHHVLRTISSLVSDEYAVQDVAQETFFEAWRNLEKLKEKHKFGGWLTQIAINLSKRWLRDQRKYQGNTTTSLEQIEFDVVSLASLRRYPSEKLRQDIWEAIDELSTAQREVVILHYISGYSYKEISEMLSIPLSTVLGRLQKARNQLRKEFLDMVTKLQLEISSTLHNFLEEHAKQDDMSVEALIIRLIERYKKDIDRPEIEVSESASGSPNPELGTGTEGVWKTYRYVDGLAGNEISAIVQDREGTIWFAARGDGVSRFDGKNWKTYTQKDGLVDNWIISIFQDKEGTIWFGSESGNVGSFDGENWRTYRFRGNWVNGILQDKDGTIWFGSRHSVIRFDGEN